jgi:hypothetical protein
VRALLLSGEIERARAKIEPETESSSPEIDVWLAAAAVSEILEKARPESMFGRAGTDLERAINRALSAPSSAPVERALETRMLAGWILTVLPDAERRFERGVGLLLEVHQSARAGALQSTSVPGLTQRFLITTAHILLDIIRRTSSMNDDSATRPARLPRSGELINLIYSVDPASEFARSAYLEAPNQRMNTEGASR